MVITTFAKLNEFVLMTLKVGLLSKDKEKRKRNLKWTIFGEKESDESEIKWMKTR